MSIMPHTITITRSDAACATAALLGRARGIEKQARQATDYSEADRLMEQATNVRAVVARIKFATQQGEQSPTPAGSFHGPLGPRGQAAQDRLSESPTPPGYGLEGGR